VKVTSESLPERQVKLQIEIDPDKHAEAMEQAYKRLAPKVQIKGFRPGKAPRPLIEKQLGQHRILDEAMDILIPDAYNEAIKEQDLSPVASPAVELVSHEPLVFTATVPLPPEVELGDYQSTLRLPKDKAEVTDDQVERELEELRHRYGTVEPVDRPIQDGDLVRGSLHVSVDDLTLYAAEEIEFHVEEDYLVSMPGLHGALLGVSKGETMEKVIEAPAEFPDERIAGQAVLYRVAVKEVKEEKLAELDDAFAKTVGESFETLDALRKQLRENLERNEEDSIRRQYESAVIDALVEKADISFPPVMLEHEIDHMLQEQSNIDPRDPQAQAIYLSRMGLDEEEVRGSIRPDAEKRLRRSIVISKFAEAENITVEETDVDAEIERMVGSVADEQADMIRNLFSSEDARTTMRRSLLTRKTLDRLMEIAGQPEEATPAAKPARQRRTAPRKVEE
jgi:trigger factor